MTIIVNGPDALRVTNVNGEDAGFNSRSRATYARVAQCRARKTPQAPIRPFIFLIDCRRAVAYGLSEVAQTGRAIISVLRYENCWFESNP